MSDEEECEVELRSRSPRRNRHSVESDRNDDKSGKRHHKRKHRRKSRHGDDSDEADAERSRRHRRKKRKHHRRHKSRNNSPEQGQSDNEEKKDQNQEVGVSNVPSSGGESPSRDYNAEIKQEDAATGNGDEALEKGEEESVSQCTAYGNSPPAMTQGAKGPVRKMAGFLPAKLSLPKAVAAPMSSDADDVWNDSFTAVSLESLAPPPSRTEGVSTQSSPTASQRDAVACAPAPAPVGNHVSKSSSQQQKDNAHKHRHGHRSHSRSCSCESSTSVQSRSSCPEPRSRKSGRHRQSSRSPHHRGRRRDRHSRSHSCSCSPDSDPSQRRKHSRKHSPHRHALSSARKRSRSPRRSVSPKYRTSSRQQRGRYRSRSRSPRLYRSRSPRRYRSRSPHRYRSRSPRRRSRSPRRYSSRSPQRRTLRRRSRSRSPRRDSSAYRRRSASPSRAINGAAASLAAVQVYSTAYSAASAAAAAVSANTAHALQAATAAANTPVPRNGQTLAREGLARLTKLCSKISSKTAAAAAGGEGENKEDGDDEDISRPVRHPFALPKADTLARQKAIPSNRREGPLAITYGEPQNTGGSGGAAGAGIHIGDIVAQLKARNPAVLKQSFPVSTGIKHQKVEDEPKAEAVAVDPTAPSGKPSGPPPKIPELNPTLIMRIHELQRQFENNPTDFQVMTQLANARAELSQYSNTTSMLKQKMHDQDRLRPMSKAELESGIPAWAKKDMFFNLNPVREGFGAKMLRRQGWSSGKPLGKTGDGFVEPVVVAFKADRKGLASAGEGPGRKSSTMAAVIGARANGRGASGAAGGSMSSAVANTMVMASMTGPGGKHPVSVLMEYCSRMRVPAPDYSLVMDTGPQHSKSFKFKVIVQGVEYTSAMALNNKKQAKAAAAMAAVQSLGLK